MDDLPSPSDPPSDRADHPEAGVRIGDFEIVRRLGAGGMGIVYLARQASLDRLVALKILGPSLTSPVDIARFRREAQAIARLDHPAIAKVHFIGQDRDVCYLAMEFIDGTPLRRLIGRLETLNETGRTLDSVLRDIPIGEGEAPVLRFDETTVSYALDRPGDDRSPEPGGRSRPAAELIASPGYIRRCCEILRDAALALDHAHQRAVVHRDVKPENILLDRGGRVHLIDFGLARFFEDTTLTDTGALVGTPLYMSPEQVAGRIGIDHRTDVYSLGLVLYELLTLRRPILAPTREGLLRQILTKAMPPVSWGNRAVPRGLEGVVHKAIAKDPDDRYQSAADLAADLQRSLDGKSVLASPYRHRLDEREIAAERPREVIVVALAFFFLAILDVVATSITAVVGVDSPPDARASYLLSLVLLLAVGAGCYAIGIGLLAGRDLARWSAIAICVAAGGLVAVMVGIYVVGTTSGVNWMSFGLYTSFAVIFWAVAGLLARRRITEWFRLAARLRAEHRRSAAFR